MDITVGTFNVLNLARNGNGLFDSRPSDDDRIVSEHGQLVAEIRLRPAPTGRVHGGASLHLHRRTCPMRS